MKLSTILEKSFPRAVTNAMLTLIFCLYPHQVLAQSACTECPAVAEPGADLPDFELQANLIYSEDLDPIVPGFLSTLTKFKETVGIFSRDLYIKNTVGTPFVVNGATYAAAVDSIKNALVEDKSENGGITAEDASFEIEEYLGPRQAPYPGGLIPTVKFKVFSFLGGSYIFREGRVFSGPPNLQLFGYISNSWLPNKSIAERAKAFVKVKIKEPDANDSTHRAIDIGDEALKIFLPGYSGGVRIGQGQFVTGSAEMLAGLATLGLWTKATTTRTAVAWSIVGFSGAHLTTAIVYKGTPGEILGAAIPVVFFTPYRVIFKFVSPQVTNGLKIFNVTVTEADGVARAYQRLGGKTIDAFLKAAVDTTKITFAAAKNATKESQRIAEAAIGIMRRNFDAGKGWMISAGEYLLVKERVGAITATLKRIGEKKIPYADAFSLHKLFVGQWAAFNRTSTAMMPNWKGDYEGFMGHKVLPRILSQLLPNGAHLNQTERDNLLKILADKDGYKAAVKKIMDLTHTDSNGTIRNLFEFAGESVPYSVNDKMSRYTAEMLMDAMKGFLLSSRKLDFDVYRIVQVEELADGTLKLLYPWVDKFGTNSMVATGLTPQSVMVFAKQFFGENATSFVAGSKPFAIIKFPKGTYYGAAGPGEGSIFRNVVEMHKGGVENEVVLLTGKGHIAPRATCYVPSNTPYTQPSIPIVEFVPE